MLPYLTLLQRFPLLAIKFPNYPPNNTFLGSGKQEGSINSLEVFDADSWKSAGSGERTREFITTHVGLNNHATLRVDSCNSRHIDSFIPTLTDYMVNLGCFQCAEVVTTSCASIQYSPGGQFCFGGGRGMIFYGVINTK